MSTKVKEKETENDAAEVMFPVSPELQRLMDVHHLKPLERAPLPPFLGMEAAVGTWVFGTLSKIRSVVGKNKKGEDIVRTYFDLMVQGGTAEAIDGLPAVGRLCTVSGRGSLLSAMEGVGVGEKIAIIYGGLKAYTDKASGEGREAHQYRIAK